MHTDNGVVLNAITGHHGHRGGNRNLVYPHCGDGNTCPGDSSIRGEILPGTSEATKIRDGAKCLSHCTLVAQSNHAPTVQDYPTDRCTTKRQISYVTYLLEMSYRCHSSNTFTGHVELVVGHPSQDAQRYDA